MFSMYMLNTASDPTLALGKCSCRHLFIKGKCRIDRPCALEAAMRKEKVKGENSLSLFFFTPDATMHMDEKEAKNCWWDRAGRNFTRQPLNASTRNSGKTQLGWSPESLKQSLAIQNLQLIGGTKQLHIKKLVGRPGGLGFPRIQTIMQTCLLQTPLCQNPLICAILPSAWPFPDFCLGQHPRSKQS